MLTQFIVGTCMILVTVSFHVGGLVVLALAITRVAERLPTLSRPTLAFALIAPSVLFFVLLHTIEAWSWAVLILSLDGVDGLEEALYFSTVTATTLGYGDVTLSKSWRLLGAFEAMGGLILFAVTTGFLIQLIRATLFEEDGNDKTEPASLVVPRTRREKA